MNQSFRNNKKERETGLEPDSIPLFLRQKQTPCDISCDICLNLQI